jgi:hypothetical protein
LLPGRVARGEVHLYEERRIGVCQACRLSFAYYVESPDEYLQHLGSQGFRLANVLPEYRIGRNLRVVEEAARGKSLADQVQLLYESWDDPRYYAPP